MLSDDDSLTYESATIRHPEMFKIVYEFRDLLIEWIDKWEPSIPVRSHAQILKVAFCIRAWNIYKAIIPLLERDLWEDAVILLRSLFELLLNAEYIHSDQTKEEQHVRQFLMFQELQQYRLAELEYQYRVHMGHQIADPEKWKSLGATALRQFKQFAVHKRDGSVRWQNSWCGKNVWELADASPEKLRVWQYKILYAEWSNYTHSSPLAVLSTTNHWPDAQNWEEFKKSQLLNDTHRIREVTTILVTLMIELLRLLGPVLAKYDFGELVPIVAGCVQLQPRAHSREDTMRRS